MSRSFVARLFDNSTPVRYRCALSIDDAVGHLLRGTETSRVRALYKPCMFGQVTRDRVQLQRVIPFVANSWKPVFEGRFSEEVGVAVLDGSIGTSRATRRFMKVSVGFCVLWSVGAFLSVTVMPGPQLPWWFPLAGLGMAAVTLALSAAASTASAADRAWLSQRIGDALGCNAS